MTDAFEHRPRRPVTLIGIGDDGCIGLSSRALNAVARSQVLVGGQRQLAFFAEFSGERLVIDRGFDALLDRVVQLAGENNVAILASGDPLFFGVGARVIEKLGADQVEVIPQPSSLQLAFARAGLHWDDASLLSVHGRPLAGLAVRLRGARKAAVFTDAKNHPARVAEHLLEFNAGEWRAWICENLAGPGERVRGYGSLEALRAASDVGPLNVLVLERTTPGWRAPSAIPFLHEDAFAKRMPKKGLITKLEVRLLSLAKLMLRPDSVVWDIGAGSGSVSIEAALLAPHGHVHAIEIDPEGVAICNDNIRALGTDNVTVIAGRAPEALAELPAPDAIFVGGSKGSMAEIIDVGLERLQPGGRLVANAITLENAAEAYQALRGRDLEPDVTLLQVSRAAPLARYLRYEALNPIQIFAVQKP